ncbi:gephyrin-like molybdotransferase receptor GlpR [Mycobacterium sp.]|uniref:divisome protein SepX/GlpR n=1 Tax=Mycobacterium sp. TaxID=1785 RepID=UPI0031D94EB6
MPSIPQSLLWISLVVLWLFVLVPMLVSKRDAVRRTSDVALATRVLNSAAATRLLRRGGPAAGHRSDPDWRPEAAGHDDIDDEIDEIDDPAPATVPTVMAVADEAGSDAGGEVVDAEVVDAEVVDAEVVDAKVVDAKVVAAAGQGEDELEAGDEADAETAEVETAADAGAETAAADVAADADGDDEYEYVEDTSGIPVAEEPTLTSTPAVARRRRYEADTAAAVSARKYTFRKRMLMGMALALVGSAAAALVLARSAWWVCAGTAAVTVLYLAYLRRQTRIEARLRRRRMHRMARARLGVDNTRDRDFDMVPARLRRPGAVVLEIDDEDPIFEHLDYARFEARFGARSEARSEARSGAPFAGPSSRDYGWHRDLPRAVGQ